jgi:putative endonuclease
MAEPADNNVDSGAGVRKRLGDAGERLVASWLQGRGHAIVARNWRCACGELDLIAAHDGGLIFVEVKSRRGGRMGVPGEAVTVTKRRRLIASAQAYPAEHGQEQRPYRIDVVAVDRAPSGQLIANRHYPSAVESQE